MWSCLYNSRWASADGLHVRPPVQLGPVALEPHEALEPEAAAEPLPVPRAELVRVAVSPPAEERVPGVEPPPDARWVPDVTAEWGAIAVQPADETPALDAQWIPDAAALL